MPAIIKIGYTTLLVKSEAAAMTAMKALAEAVEVDSGFTDDHKQVYWPRGEKSRDLSLTIIRHDQLRRMDPRGETKKPEPKFLDFNGKVNYQ